MLASLIEPGLFEAPKVIPIDFTIHILRTNTLDKDLRKKPGHSIEALQNM